MIPVTKPYLPELALYADYLEGIWKRQWLTNDGPLLKELEKRIPSELNSNPVRIVNNGTIALQIAIKALGISGKVITTPFTYIATTSSLVWEGCTPVFADIDPGTFNISPESIENLVDDEVTAIVATHCFGVPCNIDEIDRIAKERGLKVIYDAAHCFGTRYRGKSVFDYGDLSISSFHATKVFHMVEGGGLFSDNEELLKTVELMRNFGHDGPHKYSNVGINGKNSDVHAAMGLCVINDMEEILAKRKKQWVTYRDGLNNEKLRFQSFEKHGEPNYSYFPVIFESEKQLLATMQKLEENDIQVRRYFYPSLNRLEYLDRQEPLPVSEKVSATVLCLPMYHSLQANQQDNIIYLINSSIDNG